MKLHHSPRGGRLLLLGATCLGTSGAAFADQEVPHGKLSVDSTLVRVGAQSRLNWQIRYNENVDNLIGIVPPASITPKKDLNVRLRVIGSGKAAVKSNNGHGNNIDGVDSSNPGKGKGGPTGQKNSGLDPSGPVDDEKHTGNSASAGDFPLEVLCSVNHSDWSRVFYGLQSTVVPTDIVFEGNIQVGDTLDIASRIFVTDWLPLRSTANGGLNVLVLKNGAPAPRQISTRQYGQIEAFIKPYLSTNGKTVRIGQRELLVLFELDQQNPDSAGFDYQDIGVLLTFE